MRVLFSTHYRADSGLPQVFSAQAGEGLSNYPIPLLAFMIWPAKMGNSFFRDMLLNMDHAKLKELVKTLYSVVGELEDMFPGRHFTPDGHMVGSLGECLVADAYDLDLMTASNKGYDAVSRCGKQVEIKATQSTKVAFRSCPEHTIIIQIHSDGSFTEYYNGPGKLIWDTFKDRKLPDNGQFQIALSKVKSLNEQVNPKDRLDSYR